SAGYLEDALTLARQLAGLSQAQPVLYRRKGDPAYSLYAVSANRPIQATLIPYSVPGLDRSRLPLFLYMWQADPTMLKLPGQSIVELTKMRRTMIEPEAPARPDLGGASGSIKKLLPNAISITPPMLLPHRHHRAQDGIPRLRLHHGGVGEHAAVPADV